MFLGPKGGKWRDGGEEGNRVRGGANRRKAREAKRK